jgi:ARG/rhodanese/phosphatase superfamily protein
MFALTTPVIAGAYSDVGGDGRGQEQRMTKETDAAQAAVLDAVGQARFGAVVTFENLSMIPLIRDEERNADYLTLDDAIADGRARITEVSDAGRVSELKIAVRGSIPVLLLDGEELLGAKQNRVVNLTILAPPARTTVIPVSCVESGRWHHVSRGFASAPRAQFAEGRAAKMRQVTASLSTTGHRASDQDAVWNEIALKSARLSAASDTSAMSAMFEKLKTSVEQFVAAFPPAEHQVGAIFVINGQQAGLELFDAASTWRKLAPKLVRSYAVDAIDRRRQPARKPTPQATSTLATSLASSAAAVFPGTGDGEDVRLSGTDIAGAALVVGGRAIHVSAFPITMREAQ